MIFRNPILNREIDHRMRDNRTYWIPTVYIFILGLVTLVTYLMVVKNPNSGPGWVIGKTIFHVIAFTQMALIILLVPSVSAGAITGERDRGTLSMLLVTPMPRRRIAAGKLLASILYVLFLISTSIPFAALSFGFGGTDLRLLGITYGCIIVTVFFLASLGLVVSTLMRRTVPAILLAYGLVAALLVGSGAAELALHAFYKDFKSIVFVYLNPFTPLVLNAMDMPSAEIANKHLYWWITPLLLLLLSLIFTAVAGRRIRSLRE
ncbi:MAG: ABC transporter permease [Elusimicrobia bacterium]|nr:ABC transporter permease [Elusimicrobiota bacterium]